jgi:hypothetical protein
VFTYLRMHTHHTYANTHRFEEELGSFQLRMDKLLSKVCSQQVRFLRGRVNLIRFVLNAQGTDI